MWGRKKEAWQIVFSDRFLRDLDELQRQNPDSVGVSIGAFEEIAKNPPGRKEMRQHKRNVKERLDGIEKPTVSGSVYCHPESGKEKRGGGLFLSIGTNTALLYGLMSARERSDGQEWRSLELDEESDHILKPKLKETVLRCTSVGRRGGYIFEFVAPTGNTIEIKARKASLGIYHKE